MALAASKLEVAKAKRLWEANQLPIDAMCRVLGRSPPWLYHHMRKEGWQGRKPKEPVEAVKPKAKAFYRGWTDRTAVEREEIAAKEYLRYGHLLRDVQLLRRRGYAVNCEGPALYRVGNALIDAEELQAKAARERRLINGKDRIHV